MKTLKSQQEKRSIIKCWILTIWYLVFAGCCSSFCLFSWKALSYTERSNIEEINQTEQIDVSLDGSQTQEIMGSNLWKSIIAEDE